MFEQIHAILFDFDGTLVDSMWMWRSINQTFLAQYGEPLPADLQEDIEGLSFGETAAYFKGRFRLPLSTAEIMEAWCRMAAEKYRREVHAKSGVADMISALHDKGVRFGIASSGQKRLVETALDANGLTPFFSEIHTSDEVPAGKPAPDIYLLVAERLGVPPESCLVFEDVPNGLIAARRAGMRTCAVYDAHSENRTAEKRSLSDYYIHSYEELLPEAVHL